MTGYRPTIGKLFGSHDPGNGLSYGPVFRDKADAWRWNAADQRTSVNRSYSVVEVNLSPERIREINRWYSASDFCGIASGFEVAA